MAICACGLQSVAVRRNPFLRPLGSRKRLITLLSSLAQLSSPLCVVDEPITVEERIQARAEQSRIAGDGSESDADTFRFQLALLRAVHPSMPPTDVLTLDLSGCKLARADLGAFVNLRQLK